jgi:hypothetical protein
MRSTTESHIDWRRLQVQRVDLRRNLQHICVGHGAQLPPVATWALRQHDLRQQAKA